MLGCDFFGTSGTSKNCEIFREVVQNISDQNPGLIQTTFIPIISYFYQPLQICKFCKIPPLLERISKTKSDYFSTSNENEMNSLIKITLIKRTRNLFHSASNQNHLNEKGLESLIHFISQMGNDKEIEFHEIKIGFFELFS